MKKVCTVLAALIVLAMVAIAFAQQSKEVAAPSKAVAPPSKAVGYITKAELQALAAKIQAGELDKVMPFNSGDRYALTFSHRENDKQSAHLHPGHDEVFLIISGSTKYTLGGKLVGNFHPERPDAWDQMFGDEIQGGTTFEVHEGDIISAPRGVPHQVDARGTKVVYLVFKTPYIIDTKYPVEYGK